MEFWNSSRVTMLISLLIFSVTVAEKKDIKAPKDNEHSTITTASSKETTLENFTVGSIETTTSPEILTDDTSNINGFQVILYVFAIVGLISFTICLIQIIRSSSYCDHETSSSSSNSNHHGMGLREPRNWRRSWRNKSNSRTYAFTDQIISV